MERQIPWSRIVVEGFVIVISILLAFGIDAWWEGKQELRAGRELVLAVVEEAAANRDLIQQTIRRVEVNQAHTRRFYLMEEDELSRLHPDTAHALVQSMWVPNTYQLEQGALSAANAAEGVRLIRDLPLRNALADLQGKIADLDERFRAQSEVTQRLLFVVGRHPLVETRYLDGRESLGSVVDVRGIRDDADVLAAATVMQINREVYVIALQELLTALHETTLVLTGGTIGGSVTKIV